jgi:hypothetical protein
MRLLRFIWLISFRALAIFVGFVATSTFWVPSGKGFAFIVVFAVIMFIAAMLWYLGGIFHTKLEVKYPKFRSRDSKPRKAELYETSFDLGNAVVSAKLTSYPSGQGAPVTFTPMFRIEYADQDGVLTERDICPIKYEHVDRRILRVRAWCFLQNDTRSFRTDRVLRVHNIETGRHIQDLGRYLRREMPFLEA